MNKTQNFLEQLNNEYLKLHKKYEDLFWISYMGDHSIDKEKDAALIKRDAFRTHEGYLTKTKLYLIEANEETKNRLRIWINFFNIYQAPSQAIALKKKIVALESKIHRKRTGLKEGYLDPYTRKFILASKLKMATMKETDPDEKIRKACYIAGEKLIKPTLKEYVSVIGLRNKYAKLMGYADFYDFKVQREDGMTKKELFSIFDSIYKKLKPMYKEIRKLEKKIPGLRKPWNFDYMMAGDFKKEEDPFFQFDDALLRWGKSFEALGIDFKGGQLALDLLDRKGKENNGFCHWPDLVHFKHKKRMPGSSNFTCNVVAGQMGSGIDGYETLFHEGGHAAHYLNVNEREVILNNEYPPSSMSWAETQSMFLHELFNSIEWRHRYAKDSKGNSYPFSLYERIEKKLFLLRPKDMLKVLLISNFEKMIYECDDLTPTKAIAIARKNHKKYLDRSESSVWALATMHIYSWESSGSYHGYGLAILALTQWQEYFMKKYGYMVDNPRLGKEMAEVWKYGARYTFKDFVKMATGRTLTPHAYLKKILMPVNKTLREARKNIRKLEGIRRSKKPIDLNANISMVHGKKVIATNKKSFEDMAGKYKEWFGEQSKDR